MTECAGKSSMIHRAVTAALGLIAIASTLLLALAYYVDAARAYHDVVTVYMSDEQLRGNLSNLFPVGAARRDVEYYLSNTPISHGGYDPDTRRIEGTIRAPQRLLFASAGRSVHIVLQFDQTEKLETVTFDRG